MRVLMRTTLCGPGLNVAAGKITPDLPEAQARALIDGGFGEAADREPIVLALAGSPATRRARAVRGPDETR